MTVTTVAFWVLAALTVLAALAVVFSREMIRLLFGLGVFLLAVAAYFLLFGTAFLAATQVFVYVGGVLVMMLFAVMVIRRDTVGAPDLGSRHDVNAFVVAAGLFLVMQLTLGPDSPTVEELTGSSASIESLAETLLGPMLVHFEFVGVLLLAALVAVLAVVAGRREA